MSKESFNKFIGIVILLVILTLIKRWFNFSYAILWLGVIFGYYLPFIDHLFYAFIVRPNLEVSRNIRSLVNPKKIRQLINYINETKNQREKLIVHTAYFQVIFLLLTFYVLTSSGSIFGRGLVYGFSLNLFIEEVISFNILKDLKSWFSEIPVSMDFHKTKVYLYTIGLVLLIFTLML